MGSYRYIKGRRDELAAHSRELHIGPVRVPYPWPTGRIDGPWRGTETVDPNVRAH
ncbi:hypothetical protein GCM10010254_61510 [Streptomyces chromofuscus]|nr:hypothetical protein GCM10010254_61510 [Streptomyces chromofuscus]